jgi:hypothetical protein
MEDEEEYRLYNLADKHGWTIATVEAMSLEEYEHWWAYHRRHGDLKKAGE